MVFSTNNIFTIQTDERGDSTMVQIETLVTKGLYKFTLLGMSTRHASDTKDRVYSALRASDLLNLKSDNRKIIVNLSPDDSAKREGVYDLGIALSLIACIHKDTNLTDTIAVGGLTLSGRITASKRLYQAIYTAYINNINTVICSNEDILQISNNEKYLLHSYGIRIISANSLKDLVNKLKGDIDNNSSCKEITSSTDTIQEIRIKKFSFGELSTLQRTLLITLGGGHHVLIQSPFSNIIKNTIESIAQEMSQRRFGEKIFLAFKNKLLDTEHANPILIIENIKLLSRTDVLKAVSLRTNILLGMYAPCVCGYSYIFFETHREENKCICSKKSILQHKRVIKSSYFDLFTMHLTHPEKIQDSVFDNKDMIQMIHSIRKKQFERYINENNLTSKQIFLFPDNTFLNEHRDIHVIKKSLDHEAFSIWKEGGEDKTTLRIAQTVQDIFDLTQEYPNKKPAICKQAIVLAISYSSRMDS